MKIQGIEVDTNAIAKGIYEMFDTNEQAAVAFGMLPAEKMRVLENELDRKIEDDAKNQVENVYGFRPENNVAKQDLKADFVRESMHQISVDIFRYAGSIGKMIV